MISGRGRRVRGERGATIVEFAVVAPLLFFMLGGMLDIGLTVLGRSVATGAAREGARVGIIAFENADVLASPTNAGIKDAVDAKLVGLVRPNTGSPPYVSVRCLDGGTKAAKACTRAGIRIDYDLIEVTVKWKSISATGGTFTPANLTNVARMVIVGDGKASSGAPLGSSPVGITPTAVSVTETNGDTTVTLTIARDSGTGFASVGYATAPGSATAPGDFTAVSSQVSFFAGETSKTITITIKGDTITESNESFTVSLSGYVNTTPKSGFTTTTVTILDDDVPDDPPMLTALRMFDIDGDGKIDRGHRDL